MNVVCIHGYIRSICIHGYIRSICKMLLYCSNTLHGKNHENLNAINGNKTTVLVCIFRNPRCISKPLPG